MLSDGNLGQLRLMRVKEAVVKVNMVARNTNWSCLRRRLDHVVEEDETK